jgi:phosphoribosylformylglycinamidine synthase
MKPNILILHASGTNRDHEAAWACELAGGAPEIVHINQLRQRAKRLADYHMLVIAGGFSYGDALGAGRRLALDLTLDLSADLTAFIAAGKPILGICNGFQALVKAGLLPNPHLDTADDNPVTLTHNQHRLFECRWVTLLPNPASPCVFTRDLPEPIYCPVAHGEGRLAVKSDLPDSAIALSYSGSDYPANPNGSVRDIAGICNETGTIMGLMPHPEDHLVPWQHPRWTRGESGQLGLPLFAAGVRYAAQVG